MAYWQRFLRVGRSHRGAGGGGSSKACSWGDRKRVRALLGKACARLRPCAPACVAAVGGSPAGPYEDGEGKGGGRGGFGRGSDWGAGGHRPGALYLRMRMCACACAQIRESGGTCGKGPSRPQGCKMEWGQMGTVPAEGPGVGGLGGTDPSSARPSPHSSHPVTHINLGPRPSHSTRPGPARPDPPSLPSGPGRPGLNLSSSVQRAGVGPELRGDDPVPGPICTTRRRLAGAALRLSWRRPGPALSESCTESQSDSVVPAPYWSSGHHRSLEPVWLVEAGLSRAWCIIL